MGDLVHGEAEAERTVLRALRLAVEISIVLVLIEAVGALLSRSLSLTVDAVHNVPDIFAFVLSWTALRSAAHGASDPYTFGTHRAEVFAGLANAALVLGTGLVFGYEALATTLHGGSFAGSVDPFWLLLAAVPALGLRGFTAATLGRIPGRVRDLNFRSVVLHMVSDVVITLGLLVVAAVLLIRPGDGWVDPVVALAIAGVLVAESAPLFRDATEVLTERTPRHLSVDAIEQTALAIPGVREVHDLHVWAVCPTLICMTAHVAVREMTVRESMDVVANLRDAMERDHGILHAVFEVENLPVG
jgi:cobalt-zinc-cadmium efflux system protein